jgi:hypothetical protein
MNDLDLMVLESLVYADAAHVSHLVLEGLTDEADAYSQRPEVASRIRRWKQTRHD